MISSYAELSAALAPLKEKLRTHELYQRVDDVLALQTFMEQHSFAVWDFMSLLKTLQRHFTCVTVPWLPPSSPLAARLVNEIVLAEESDEIEPGHFRGHFDLYVESLGEVEANGRLILEFVERLRSGEDPHSALDALPILPSTRAFVLTTLDICQNGQSHEVAASFLLGREDLIPEMFAAILPRLGVDCGSFKTYLRRHIELDAETHGPMGVKLLREICGTDARLWNETYLCARRSLEARVALWDGILDALNDDRDQDDNQDHALERSAVFKAREVRSREPRAFSFARESAARQDHACPSRPPSRRLARVDL